MAGISKEQRAAKKTLEQITKLQDLVNEDFLVAYQTISDMSRDSTIPASVRKGAAMEIIKMGLIFAEAADKLTPEPSNREEEREQEVTSTVTSLFSREAKK